MKLPIFFPKQKKKTEYFLALLLSDERANAVIFEEVNGVIRQAGEHEEYFSQSIESASAEELLDTLDKTISIAEEKLPEDVETQKTIFGVKETWVKNNAIKKEYLSKLKKVSDALTLSPIGFLVVIEALVHLLTKEEGAPVSGIFIDVGKKHIVISLLRAGKIVETKQASIEDSIPKTTDKLLHHFTKYEILPSRIILLNVKNDDLSQEFISHTWSKSLPFLHVPQITVLSKGFDARAVLFGAATQMGFDVLKETHSQKPTHVVNKEVEETIPQKDTPVISNDQSLKHETFGFIKDHDIQESLAKIQTEESYPTQISDKNKEQKSVDEFGFSQEERVLKTAHHAYKKIPVLPFTLLIGFLQSGGFLFLRYIKLIAQNFHISFRGGRKIVFVPPAILLLAIGLLFGYIFGLHATVTFRVSPKIVEDSQNIIISTGSPTDFSKNQIEATLVSTDVDGSLSTQATGTKEIGDKAKGSVTIYSKFTQEKILPAGTIFTSSNDLQFTLDESIKLSSASAGASALPVTTKGSVTAKNIGKESNLPSGAKFTVALFDISDIEAKNDTAFSGGTKKEVIVVSKNDIDKLTNDLPKNLEQKAKDNISGQQSSDILLLPMFITTTVSKKTFDKNVGEETKTILLKATVTYQSFSYKKQLLDEFSKNLLKNNNQNMSVAKNGISYELKDIKKKNDTDITATLSIKAPLIPHYDTAKISQEVNGKSFQYTQDYFMKLPQAEDVSIRLSPNIPFLPRMLPKKATNISVFIVSNE